LGGGGGPRLVQGGLQPGGEVLQGILGLLQRDGAPAHESLGVQLADAAVILDQLVQQRLGEGRVVLLVVAVAPVTDHVDDHVLVEFLAEVQRQSGHADTRLGVVAVHMEYRCLDHLCNVSRVHRRPSRIGVRRKTKLVVDDQVNGATGFVRRQRRHVQCFCDYALASEGGITVDDHREDDVNDRPGKVVMVCTGSGGDRVLEGPRHALDDGAYRLEMGRVRREGHVELIS
jgi:hypothetical protein